MPLIRIQRDQGIKRVFIAGEGIADLATIELIPDASRLVRMGSTGNEHLAAGVARGAATDSGELVRVITHGIVSGVLAAQAVEAGDRLTIATSGRVVSLNTITPLINLTSGEMLSGGVGVDLQALVCTSGPITGVTGIQPFYTGRVLGKALTSGASGLGIQMLVSLE